MPENTDYSKELVDGKNSKTVTCQFCPSIVLTPASATMEKFEFDLPLMTQNKCENTVNTEKVDVFWMVEDMYTFHNVGFSNTVDSKKYLICADCDAGPIGYHDLSTKKSFVALSRVLSI